jgi:hypothetical protein
VSSYYPFSYRSCPLESSRDTRVACCVSWEAVSPGKRYHHELIPSAAYLINSL